VHSARVGIIQYPRATLATRRLTAERKGFWGNGRLARSEESSQITDTGGLNPPAPNRTRLSSFGWAFERGTHDFPRLPALRSSD